MSLRIFLAAAVLAIAAFPQTPTSTPAPPAEVALLKIVIDPSRSPIAMDTEAGISAEIKNVTSVPLRLYENETVFVTTPETRIYGETRASIQGCATFPTQGNVRPAERPKRGYDLLLQPGDSYRVFWDIASNGCTAERQVKVRFWNQPLLWFEQKWQRMTFDPGIYKVYLDVVVYPEGQQVYRTSTEGQDVRLSASQQMVLLGAFLGGILSYVIKLYYGVNTPLTVRMQNRWLRNLLSKTEWLVAGLFGAAMVILASRLSDTFPIKVSADDFWGSVTLGFAFQWIGVKLLEKLPGLGPTASPTPSGTDPTPPPGAP